MGDLGSYLVLVVICVLFVIPVAWIFSTSLKPTSEILVTPTITFRGARPWSTIRQFSRAIFVDI
jgi:ABC-type glycerol-3-phosphate transport system permease component